MNYLSPFGDSCGVADLKTVPEDFIVIEMPSYKASGEGEHVWLKITKRNLNTAWVAEQLAHQSGIKLRDVSYAGRKDKIAVSTQWFSLYDPKRISDAIQFDIPDCKIELRLRHLQKLRIGNLLGNKFEIRLRNFEGNFSQLENRVEEIKQHGFPNYFGPQRFGNKFQNIPRAFKWIQNGAGRLRREQRSIYLSTLRSFLFNKILSLRIEQQNWNKIISGELVQLDGSHSIFHAEGENYSLDELHTRCAALDIHPTAILCGQAELHTTHEAHVIESEVLKEFQVISDFLINEMTASRRTLRVLPKKLMVEMKNKDVIVSFSLTAGSYATVLLNQLVEVKDQSH